MAFSDSPPVKAALEGSILVLATRMSSCRCEPPRYFMGMLSQQDQDGLERAERNVLPTLNNLLLGRLSSLLDRGQTSQHLTVPGWRTEKCHWKMVDFSLKRIAISF